MKKIYPVFAIALIFTACSKEEMPDPDINDPVVNIVEWNYELSYDTDGDGVENFTANASMYNGYFPDNTWRLTLYEFTGNGYSSTGLNIYDMSIGEFEFGFLRTWTSGSSVTDTIYGSGYFDQDTMYISYTFMNVEDPSDMGVINIHSY